uniref:MARVEL domain-containing protein n=1 Tax=Magallana gigas TaxID=29159 RepID=A0A8W8KHZ8_MAGGI|nr:CKLF-like MARVEL transmembrane domain-containing protein 4 isoform X2 [Crassostrea gigas]
MQSTEESDQSPETQGNTRRIGNTCVSINLTFVKSRLGIFEAAIIILSFICLICTWAGSNLACDYTYGSSYGFFEFVAGSVFLTDFINYLIFALTIDEKWCMKFVPWLVWHFFIGAIFTFFLLIASIVMVSHMCGQGGYAAAAVFGFITTIVSGVETYFLLAVSPSGPRPHR